jgi:hypothetical protein
MSDSNDDPQSVDDQTEGVLIIIEEYPTSERRVTGPVVDLVRAADRCMPSTSGRRTRRPVVSRPRFRIEFTDRLFIPDENLVDMIGLLEADLIYPGWVSKRVRLRPRSQR